MRLIDQAASRLRPNGGGPTQPTSAACKISAGSPQTWWRNLGIHPAQPPVQAESAHMTTCVWLCSHLPALCASPKRISVMLLGSLWDLPRCNTRSSSSPSDDAMVTTDAQFQRRDQPRSSARRAGGDLMWLECCGCSSWSTIRSRAGEIHYAHSIMPPSGAARKILL